MFIIIKKLPKKSWKGSDIFVCSTWSGIPLDCTSHHKNNYDKVWLFNFWLYMGLFKCPSVKADYLMNCSNILFFNKVTERKVTFLYVWSRYTFKLCASHHVFGCFRYSRVVSLSSCKFPQGGFIVRRRLHCIPQLLKKSTVSHFCNLSKSRWVKVETTSGGTERDFWDQFLLRVLVAMPGWENVVLSSNSGK